MGVEGRLSGVAGVKDSLLPHMSQEAGGKAETIMFSMRTALRALSVIHQDQKYGAARGDEARLHVLSSKLQLFS